MYQSPPGIAIVTRPTRLEGLKRRWGTAGQAAFALKQARLLDREVREPAQQKTLGGHRTQVEPRQADALDFDEYQTEDHTYQAVVDQLERDLDFGLPIKMVDRSFLPNFNFDNCEVVVVVGQDGLVANAAKYVGSLPIVAVNPDPQRIDGVLLPFSVKQATTAVKRVLDKKFQARQVTLAQAKLNDGQRMLAFNDLFIGAASHISARYTLESRGQSEPQSSSGVIVSTGVGSTGWLSSIFNMTSGVAQFIGGKVESRPQLSWEDRRLAWAVREPFVSRQSQASLVAGWLEESDELIIESQMPETGVIFSDGVEQDFLPFNSGAIVRIQVSPQRANLVIK